MKLKPENKLEKSIRECAEEFWRKYPTIKHFEFVKDGFKYVYQREKIEGTDKHSIRHYSIEKYDGGKDGH
jgi:hypothetical protein